MGNVNERPVVRANVGGNNNNDDNKAGDKDIIELKLEDVFALLMMMQNAKKQPGNVVVNQKVNIKKNFKVYCGIDFGTHGFGLAYAYKDVSLNESKNNFDDSDDDKNGDNDDNIYDYEVKIHKWDDIALEVNKLSACMAIDPESNEAPIFGNEARIHASNRNRKNYNLLENYKMHLYTHNNQKVSMEIKSLNNNMVNTELVFVESIKYLKNEALEFLNKNDDILTQLGLNDDDSDSDDSDVDNKGNDDDNNGKKNKLSVDDIQWILTIPAIWGDQAKHCMKNWGIQAGLLNKDITNHLRVVLEPECASLQTQFEFKNEFNDGDRYIIIDAGGGTVDIVSHEIFGNFGVKEVSQSRGGPYGSTNIDKKIDELLTIVFDHVCGNGTMQKFKEKQPKQYVKMLENIVFAKKSFYGNNESENTSINLRYEMVQFLAKQYKKRYKDSDKNLKFMTDQVNEMTKDFKDITNIFGIEGQNLVKLSSMNEDYNIIEINHKIWEYIFDTCCMDGIISIVRILFDEMKSKGIQFKYIFTVGGLSRNKYFQKRIKTAFNTMTVLSTKDPLLSVVYGAARYGILGNFVMRRILKKTYCVEVTANGDHVLAINHLKSLVKYIESDGVDEKTEESITKAIDIFKSENDEFKQNCINSNNDRKEMKKHLANHIRKELDDEMDKPILNETWILANSYMDPFTKKLRVRNLLSILARKGDEIIVNGKDKIVKNYKRISKEQKKIHVDVYESDLGQPLTTDDGTLLCRAEIDLSNLDDDCLDVNFEINFDDSLLVGYVYPPGKRMKPYMTEVAINYSYKQS